MNNIISNAIKYSNKGGKVKIVCERKNGVIVIAVKDTGIGIKEDKQSEVFKKFFRTDEAVKTVADGNGLGLFIAKAIVESHGGKMWLESMQDKGSNFYMELPIK